MDDLVLCRAVCILSVDGRKFKPGEECAFERKTADELHALNAVELVAGIDPARGPDRATQNAQGAGEADAPGRQPLTVVKGIGPKTAERLRAAGVDSLAALAALADEELARTAAALDVIGDERAALTRWRDDARTLLSGDA